MVMDLGFNLFILLSLVSRVEIIMNYDYDSLFSYFKSIPKMQLPY